MKTAETDRYLRLERLLQKPFFDETEVYLNNSSKESQREKIAQEIKEEILIAPPSRLLTMISQSLRWQQLKGSFFIYYYYYYFIILLFYYFVICFIVYFNKYLKVKIK